MSWSRRYAAATVLMGWGTAVTGGWFLALPRLFADHADVLHELGAFQLGIAVLPLLALAWRDALATVLAGFLLANTVHAVNHLAELDQGDHRWQAWTMAAVFVATAIALGLRLAALGRVFDAVTLANTPAPASFVQRKTVSLATYRRGRTTGGKPASIAVHGHRAHVYSFEKGANAWRLRDNPAAEMTASTAYGRGVGVAPGAAVPDPWASHNRARGQTW